MLRTQIDSNLSNLDNLNLIYPWIPNSQSIRPIHQVIQRKKYLAQQIDLEWKSYKDYIYHIIFGEKDLINENGIKYVDYQNFKYNIKWTFQPSMFPYNIVSKNTNHWILWNSEKDFNYDYTEEVINQLITENLLSILDFDYRFEFVWYKNPKPTIPEFYHIQVFWIKNNDL